MKTLLIDTHALIWFLDGDKSLSDRSRIEILSPENRKIVSIASIWEMAIKIGLKKLEFKQGFDSLLKIILKNGFEVLPITFEHALAVSTLDFIHKDPFDRILVAQALTENIIIITHDKNIQKYPVTICW